MGTVGRREKARQEKAAWTKPELPSTIKRRERESKQCIYIVMDSLQDRCNH